MSRESSLWFRRQTGWYYTTLNGKQIKLARDRGEAKRALRELLAANDSAKPVTTRVSVRVIADQFLTYCQRTLSQNTYRSRRYYLQKLCDRVGRLPVAELKVIHVTELEAAHSHWRSSTVATVRSIVQACFNWAEAQGIIPENPVRKLKAGTYERRERTLSVTEREAIRNIVPPHLRDFLDALELTGARPYSEVAILTADMIDWAAGVIPIARHKNKKKGKARTIFLSPRLEELLRRKCAEHPNGLLFRTRRGVRWTAPHMHYWLRKLEKRLGMPRISLYAWRHTMITDALERGLTGDVVAELVGNSPQTIHKYYSKLSGKTAALRAAAHKAVTG